MSDIAIKIENLSKKYVIGAKDDRFLYERITNGFKHSFQEMEKRRRQNFGHCVILTLRLSKGM
jgi:hypothetical protein